MTILKRKNEYGIFEGASMICSFDTVKTAAVVLRFMRGAKLEEDDYRQALAALNEYDIKECEKLSAEALGENKEV